MNLGISRPVYALVKPSLDDLDEAVWKSRRFETIKADFESFIDYLDYTISRHSRVLSTLRARDQLSITKWFKSKSQPPDELIHYLKTELEHIYGGMPTERVEPKHFYKGLVNSWGIFEQELDVRRRVTDDLLLNCILDKDASKVVRCFLLNGHAGSGKNITLRRTAWEAALEYEQLVLYLKEGGTLRRNQIFELCNIVGERITIFIDDAIQELENIVGLIDFAKKHNLQLTLIFGARTNEWNVYGEDLASHLEDEFDLRDLSESEISLLLTKLKQHKCLGHLASLTEEQRMAAFKIGAERQLLVALHEATSGKPFEKLVFDEYHNIVPTEARILYLDICTLHRLGAKVRAGLISRISGINFGMFKENLLRPLDHVVRIYEDRIIRDYIYRSRHSLIAKFVFEQALIKPEQRSEQIIRMLQFMNIDYRCDEEAFNELIKGKELAEIFADRSLPDQIYDTAEKIGANISHIRHQQAIFELNHPDGSIRRASEAIREAELNTKRGLSSICHTKAVIFRKAALETTHNLEREKYRKDAKEILHKQIGNTNDSYPFHVLGQVIIDEVRDKRNEYWIDRSQTENDRLQERTITDLISQAENIISQGLQTYPNDEYLLSLQADLSNILRDEPRAVQALERAFKNNPRSDVIATRLANHYARSENPDEAEKVLNRCLEQNPGSKRVHLLLSQIYMNQDEELHKNSISHHLKRSFTEGDVNYSAQMYYGRHMFLYGDMEEAERIFGNLRSQRFSPKQRNEVWGEVRNKDGSLTEYSGYVKYPYDSYCFVNISSLRRDIFIHHRQFKPKEWEEVRTNTPIRCNLAFTVRGVCGINPRIQN